MGPLPFRLLLANVLFVLVDGEQRVKLLAGPLAFRLGLAGGEVLVGDPLLQCRQPVVQYPVVGRIPLVLQRRLLAVLPVPASIDAGERQDGRADFSSDTYLEKTDDMVDALANILTG
jgi:hypothetical protein